MGLREQIPQGTKETSMSDPEPRYDAGKATRAQERANRNAAQLNATFGSGTRSNIFGDELNFTPVKVAQDGTPVPTNMTEAERIDFERAHGPIVTKYESSVEAGADTQGLIDKSTNIANIGADRLINFKSGPLTDRITQRQIDLGSKFLDPELAKRRALREAQRARQGIAFGSDAFSDLEGDISAGEDQAWNRLLLDSRNTARGEVLDDFNMANTMFGGGINARNSVGSGAMSLMPPALAPSVGAAPAGANYDKQFEADHARWSATPGPLDIALKGGQFAATTALTGNPLIAAGLTFGGPSATAAQYQMFK